MYEFLVIDEREGSTAGKSPDLGHTGNGDRSLDSASHDGASTPDVVSQVSKLPRLMWIKVSYFIRRKLSDHLLHVLNVLLFSHEWAG